MANPAIESLLKKTDKDLIASLNKLSFSSLNSLLLEVFRQRAASQSVKKIMAAYKENRFVSPSILDPVPMLKIEVQLLELAQQQGFTMIELSPLAPLGSTSSIAFVDQNKIVSSLRGTEVVADATNVLALEAAVKRTEAKFDTSNLHYGASHRHVRAQSFSGEGFTAHFKILCLVSAGRDQGNFSFEKMAVLKHIQLYNNIFVKIFNRPDIKIIIKEIQKRGEENRLAKSVWNELQSHFPKANLTYEEVDEKDHRYYQSLRFSINLDHNGKEFNIGDGGFVDWGMKLTGNKKERMFTSGSGTEFLFKLLNGLI